MYKVTIVVPSWHYWAEPCRIQPLYEFYFATVIDSHFKGKKVSVNIVDLRGIKQDNAVYHIPQADLYFYWIAKAGDYTPTAKVINKLREVYPGAKHASGGTHIEIIQDEAAQDFDAVISGPVEESIKQIIKDGMKGRIKKLYKGDYKNVHFKDYPIMKRHYLPETAVVNNHLFSKYGPNIRSTCVLFSRGCCFRCKFCVYNVPGAIQMRTYKSIEEEIKYLKKEYKVEAINLKDEICVPVSNTVAKDFLNTIKRGKVMWRGQTTVTGINKDKVALAKASGCIELAVGVESVSQQVLDIVDKKITVEQIKNFIKLCREYEISVKMCLIFGLPGEPQNIVELTKSFIEEVKPNYVSLSGFDPVPGSFIFNNCEDYGIENIDKNWEKHAHLLYRFSDKEEVGLPFNYKKTNKWGKTFTREEIIDNIRRMQQYLREHKMTY